MLEILVASEQFGTPGLTVLLFGYTRFMVTTDIVRLFKQSNMKETANAF